MEILGVFTHDDELKSRQSDEAYAKLKTYLYFDQVRQIPYAKVQKKLEKITTLDDLVKYRDLLMTEYMPQGINLVKQQEEIQVINKAYSNTTLKIFSHYDNLALHRKKKLEVRSAFGQEFEKAEMRYVAQQIFPWFCRFKLYSSVFWLMEHAHCSPFVLGKNGYNALHQLAQQGNQADLLDLLLNHERKYEFWEPQNPALSFSWYHAVLLPDRFQNQDSPLHMAVIQKDADAFQVFCLACQNDRQSESEDVEAQRTRMLKNQVKIFSVVNNRGWNALELSMMPKKTKESEEAFAVFEKYKEITYQAKCFYVLKSYPLNSVEIEADSVFTIANPYQYMLITQADNQQIEKASIYIQLNRIAQNVKQMTGNLGKLTFKFYKGTNNVTMQQWSAEKIAKENSFWTHLKRLLTCQCRMPKFSELSQEMKEKKFQKILKNNQYIYLVKIDQVTMNHVAKILGFKVFDVKKKYYKEIDLEDTSDNEPFRDIQIQQMIIYLLEQEFDLQQYTEIGLVKEHFPCHHFEDRKNISDLWKKYFRKTLFEPLSPVEVQDALLPLKQIAFYHGIQNGFYFGYLVTFTSFMLPLSLAGIAAFIYNLLDKERSLNVTLLPFTCIFTSLWMSFFFET